MILSEMSLILLMHDWTPVPPPRFHRNGHVGFYGHGVGGSRREGERVTSSPADTTRARSSDASQSCAHALARMSRHMLSLIAMSDTVLRRASNVSTQNGVSVMKYGPVHTAHDVRARVRTTMAVGVTVIGAVALTVGLALPGTTDDDSTDRTVHVIENRYDAHDDGRRVMTQDDFPCNEDEVLGYHPSFGSDHVGCMNVEDVER